MVVSSGLAPSVNGLRCPMLGSRCSVAQAVVACHNYVGCPLGDIATSTSCCFSMVCKLFPRVCRSGFSLCSPRTCMHHSLGNYGVNSGCREILVWPQVYEVTLLTVLSYIQFKDSSLKAKSEFVKSRDQEYVVFRHRVHNVHMY